ncbi:hypothetical protein M1M38_gp063 [Halorubrum tailed virus 27]|uniref:Uncharacterized protein n=1 Tax=Halorubrum tailed virus 27 TaxID=2878008 RepID=A0AAE8XYH5_9CAUD|nr:hypothetical protein M1M38_gp063 [Halorubrum tailed virus 27]UBF22756.1 hypothetical protein HRTV-27_gp63 [Halorubrum tailed virus 27]
MPVPSLHESLKLLEDDGLVGEAENALSCLVLYPRGGLVAITGPASTGKTWMLERVERAYGSGVSYHVPTTASPTALFYDHKDANRHPVHIWPDITEMGETWESILKAIGEGKPADRKVTDINIRDEDGDIGTSDMTIQVPRTTFMVFASNNENFNSNELPELISRSLGVSMDSTAGQTQRVLERQAEIAAGLYVPQLDPSRADEIKNHLRGIQSFVADFERQGGRFLNPILPEVTKEGLLPTIFPEARRDFKKLKKFMEAMALFHYEDRPRFMDDDGNPVLVVTPEDAWLSMKVFGERLVLSALSLTMDDLTILTLVRTRKSAFSAAQIRQEVAKPIEDGGAGLTISTRDVRRSLENMAEKGYIQPNEEDSPKTYQPGFFAPQVDHSTAMPWADLLDRTAENARDALPDYIAEDYVAEFCENPAATHPITGDVVEIREDAEFEAELAEKTRDMEDALGSNPFTSSESDEEEDEADAAPDASEPGDGQSGFGTFA